MLIELAIGDAYGAGFEYAPETLIRQHNRATHYVQHPRHRLRPGCYTDDTQMSLAVAEALLSGSRWSPELLARHFVEAYRRDPREGYARGFQAFLNEVRDGEDFLARIRPDSDKSGAAMRAAPLGLLPTVGQVVDRCRVQAKLTHDTPDGVNAAVAAALMVHYCWHDLGPRKDLGRFLEGQVEGPWSAAWTGKVGPKGWMSVRAAITAVARNESLEALLIDCVSFTGDVDTVASIAMAAASCSPEYARDLPENLLLMLENGPFGRDYIVALDARLLAFRG